jgi:hypothetical protein
MSAAQPIAYRYPLHRKVRDRISRAVRDWRLRRLDRLLLRLEPNSNYVKHCQRELASWFNDEGPNRWMAEHMVRMLRLFATEGHSGSSAPFAVAVFKELAMFRPWGPLTGAEDEWGEPFDNEEPNAETPMTARGESFAIRMADASPASAAVCRSRSHTRRSANTWTFQPQSLRTSRRPHAPCLSRNRPQIRSSERPEADA